MTARTKRLYLLGLGAIFCITIPAIILYSSGYRLTSKLALVRTGGIYLANSESDVSARINGKIKKRSDLFEKNLLILNL
ncbi:MAG: hypothetical protein ACRCUT_01875, partial [Spirochaetota bacterium]